MVSIHEGGLMHCIYPIPRNFLLSMLFVVDNHALISSKETGYVASSGVSPLR